MGRMPSLVLFFALWSAFTVWSWHSVRRRARERFPVIGRFGLNVHGVAFFILLSVSNAVSLTDPSLGGQAGMAAFWRQLPRSMIICFPLAIWGGYFFNWMLYGSLERIFPNARWRK